MTDNAKNRFPIFHERIKKLRGNMSQAEFATKVGISKPSVGAYETGTRIPDILVLKRIAEVYGVSSDYLLGLCDEPSTEFIERFLTREGIANLVDDLKREMDEAVERYFQYNEGDK